MIAPTGKDSEGVDTALKLLATRGLGGRVTHRTACQPDLVEHNANAAPAERANRQIAAHSGYDRRMTPELMVVTDFVYAQGRERGEADRLLESARDTAWRATCSDSRLAVAWDRARPTGDCWSRISTVSARTALGPARTALLGPA